MSWGRALLLLGLACAHSEPPALTTRQLAGGAVTFRPWGGAGICDAEPRFLLDELSAVNGGLSRWLDRARGDTPEVWSESRIAEVNAQSKVLGELVREHTVNLEAVARCGFAGTPAFVYVRSRGVELLETVAARARELDTVHARARAARAHAAWARGLDAEREAARRECPARSAVPRVFFAWRNDEGVTRWLFCDGVSVEQPLNGGPVVLQPPGGSAKVKARFGEAQYLDAARGYPAGRVSTPPPPA